MESMTKGMNQLYSINVITTRGNVPIDKLVPGDNVYEYKTGYTHEVQSIQKTECIDMIEVIYSDKRTSLHGRNERMFVGAGTDKICSVETFIKFGGAISESIPQYSYTLNERPGAYNPYVDGALFMYGDINDLYLNIKVSNHAPWRSILNHYNWGCRIANNRIYFTDPLTLYGKIARSAYKSCILNNDYTPKCPCELNYAWRKQIVKSAFDLGYRPNCSETCSIFSESDEKLEWLQKVLWSLGVITLITYRPDQNIKEPWKLTPVGKYTNEPAFFTHEPYAAMMTNMHDAQDLELQDCNVTIKGYREIPQGSIYNIQFEQPEVLYLTDNFIPRASL